MTKKDTTLVKLVSTAKSGYFYIASKNFKKFKEKLTFKKYDPVIRKHVLFKEKKMH